ncbi:MAG: DUF1549 and DUF1553 domain-containing protein, partial [Aureliella sp.]
MIHSRLHCSAALRYASALMLMAVVALGQVRQTASMARAAEPAADDEVSEPPITEGDREHWSFQPLRRPELPQLETNEVASDATVPQGPIDLFIIQRLGELQLGLAPPAPPQQLLRRLAFDLTGLPPSPEMLARFEEHAAEPDAYERAVDRLLASPAFGEHMAQSWLDLARFAETDGFEHDKVRAEAWRYRDWVIDAFNRSIAYDRFMALQVAGDLIGNDLIASDGSGEASGGDESSVATMFCLAGPDMPDINDQEERRHNLLNEMTGTVGAVFLGLQLGCAACHDHKYDPVSQADFYRLRGVLEAGVAELKRDKPYLRLQEQDVFSTPRLYQRGDHHRPGAELVRGVPRIAASDSTASRVAQAEHPRLALARWLTSPQNPLPARTMANRIWQSHFGRGLAATPSDLGVVGIEPTHPQLLDWLACELREGQWDLKRLRRQVILSATYRQSSLATSSDAAYGARLERDADNRAYSRYPRRRLTGEMLRDAMLSSAGLLNRQAGGPSVMPPLPEELVSTLLPGQWQASRDPADHHRRSIYVFARRNLRYPIFESFDRPDAGASCPERGRSITATQSLLLMNSEFSLGIAQQLAARATRAETLDAQADVLWRSLLSRAPTAAECQLLK